MYPVLFTIGTLPISSFGILFLIGFIIGACFIFSRARADFVLMRHQLNEERILDLVILTSFFGLVGARFLYVLFHFEQFGFDPLKWVLFTYFPGLSLLGALAASLAFLVFSTRRTKLPLYPILDIAGLGFILGAPVAFLGGFLGETVSTIPVYIIEAFLFFLLFWVLLFLKRRGVIRKDGVTGLTILIIFAIVSFGFEFVRYDKRYIWFLTVTQLMSLLIGFGALGVLFQIKRTTVLAFLRKHNFLW